YVVFSFSFSLAVSGQKIELLENCHIHMHLDKSYKSIIFLFLVQHNLSVCKLGKNYSKFVGVFAEVSSSMFVTF
ncbi:MAG: hypothetical protein ACK55Z_03520, partial [bacterium]